MKKKAIKLIKPKNKLIKLQAKLENRAYKPITVPELKISGKWLKENGFSENKCVEIIYGEKYLLILPYNI